MAQDHTGIERWVNEGGHTATAALIASERAAEEQGRSGRSRPKCHVLIVGGGVAGLETLLALHALAGDRVQITIVAPELKFINRSMAVAQPFHPKRVRGVRMQDITTEVGARWHHGRLDRVEHDRRRAITTAGDELPYDLLVLALGAHPEHEWHPRLALTFDGIDDGPTYRLLLKQLLEGRIREVAFVKPGGASWPLPLYDLALSTAACCVDAGVRDVKLSLVTPEGAPLEIFGETASAATRGLLHDNGVALLTSSAGTPTRPGWLDIAPGGRGMRVDRIVTQPRLIGPRLRGIPCGHDGFLEVDAHGRLAGLDGVYAAGDATTFSIKQGGLAAQQADAVAEAIAASAGADIHPQPFRPILRGLLLIGDRPLYLQTDLSGGSSGAGSVSPEPLWRPPNKVSGRYLGPYLSARVGDAADVMPQRHDQGVVDSILR